MDNFYNTRALIPDYLNWCISANSSYKSSSCLNYRSQLLHKQSRFFQASLFQSWLKISIPTRVYCILSGNQRVAYLKLAVLSWLSLKFRYLLSKRNMLRRSDSTSPLRVSRVDEAALSSPDSSTGERSLRHTVVLLLSIVRLSQALFI